MPGLQRWFGTPRSWRPGVRGAAVAAALAVAAVGAPAAGATATADVVPDEQAQAAAVADEPLTAPDVVSARAIARLEGKPVEVVGERSELGSVFALPDGTMAAGLGSGPVWVREGGDGTHVEDWAPVDLTLVAQPDGTVRPVAQSGDLTLSGGTGAGPTSSDAPVAIATMTEPATEVTTRVLWEGPLPAPRLEGRRAVYPDVRPGVDLVMEATSTGYEQFFVINERPAVDEALDLSLTVETDGAELAAAADGGLQVVDDGAVVATAPPAQMWDATSDEGRAFPITQARPVEAAAGERLSPMPAWVTAKDHGATTATDGSAAPPDADSEAAPAPVVGDGSVDSVAGVVEVEREAVQPDAETATVTLSPQADFLQDPATTYPVVVDPDVSFALGFDTYVLKGTSGDRSGEAELDVGTYDGGAHVGRAFLTFDTSAIAGKAVTAAYLDLANFYSWSCQPRNWQVWSAWPAGPGTVWDNQPAWGGLYATVSDTHGYSSSCAGAWTSVDITRLAQDWAVGEGSEGNVGLKAENEADNFGWKKFFSANHGRDIPSIWVTYNSTPNVPTGVQVTPSSTPSTQRTWATTATPRISATLSDPDGGYLRGAFTFVDVAAQVVVYGSYTGEVPSGSVASLDVPAGVLHEGTQYAVAVQAHDGAVLGPQAEWFWFGVDLTPPPAPNVTSATFPSDDAWHGAPGQAGTFTLSLPTSDSTVTAYRWGLDKAPDPAQQVTTEAGAAASLSITPADAGRHTLQVQSVDRAGNVSGVSKYTFRVGKVGIVSPTEATKVVRRVRLTVEAMPDMAYMHFQWRRGPDSPESEIQDVPASLLATSDGTTWDTSWRALPTGSGYTTWDVGAALGYQGGPAQVRAQVSASADGSSPENGQWVTVVVDPDAGGAATSAIGPGSVNLLTGDHTLSVTDAEEFGLSLVRTTSSRDVDSGFELQPNALTKAQEEATTVAGHTGSAAVGVDSTRFHSGTTSSKITPRDWSDSYVGIAGDAGGLRLSMRPGRTYRVSGWIYVPAATGLSPEDPRGLRLVTYVRDGAYAVAGQSPRPTVVDAWQQISVDVTIPAGATEAFVRMYDGFSSSSKVVYFDDVTVQELWSPFGPEWSLGTVDGASGTAYTRITRAYDDVVSLELTGGGEVWFTAGSGGKWWPEPGAESLTLTETSATTWRVTELDGTVTDFRQNAARGDFPIEVTSAPGAAGAARYVYDVAAVPGVARLARIIAPVEPGVDGWPTNTTACTTPVPARGCEVMDLDYAATTTAVGAAVGSYAGRVSTASVWTPDSGTGMVRIPVASYAYTAAGRLAQVHDPRIVASGAPALVTVYDYDTAGRLTSVTAPGDAPYRYTYGVGGTMKTGAGDWIDPLPGRLLKVTRASLVPGTTATWGPDNTTTVVYGVPLTRAAGGPYDLDATAIGTWAQSDGPTDATAIFGPLDVPAVTSATSTSPGEDGYGPATVSYLNASGLEVDTASPAAKGAPVEGFIDTAEYDMRGNVVRTLDATNRLLALKKLPNAQPMLAAWGLQAKGSVELSQLLDSRSTYSEDGLDLLTSIGPVQRLAVGNDPADVRTLRPRTVNVYDEGKPDGASYHLLTTATTTGLDPTTGENLDPLVTTNGYAPIDGAPALGATSGWVHKQPTAVTVDAGQPDALTSTVVYDARGRAIRSSKPGSTGTDAGTTTSVFYTAGSNADDASCANKPEWAGQPCLTRAAGAVTGHDAARMSSDLPVKRVEAYNGYGSPTVVTDSVGSGSGLVKRTATTTYDAADRVTSVSLTGTGTGVGASIAKTTTTYEPTTGDVVRNASVDSTGAVTAAVSKEYDKLGRLTKYTDAAGAWTATTYDRLGQPLTVTDSIGATRTYEYDRTVESRGFVTKMTDSVAGAITPTWGPDGQLESQALPGGVRLTLTYDTARVPTARTYTRISDGVVIASDSVVENQRGQWIAHTSDAGARTYTYDRLGRLTAVDDTSMATGACTSRRYGFDTHTNRTSLSSAAASSCPGTTGAMSTTSTYDSADRLVTTSGANGSAWTYDKLGRIVAMPTADGAAVASTGYFVNDLVASQEVPGVQRSTWTLDPLQRFAQQSTFAWVNDAWANSTESLNHYDGDSDEPSWIAEDLTQPDKVSRYVEGMDGAVAVQTGKAGSLVLQLVDLHGDITATLPIADGAPDATWAALQFTSFDEFGVPQPMTSGQTGNAPPARYGWLGAAQRSADTPTGTILMGVRLYAPALGRFLQTDPVAGGSANAYDYCNADPVNCTDLAGTFSWKGALKVVAVVADLSSSFIPGPAGAAVGAIAAGAYLAVGDKQAAKMAAIGAAATLVGLGVAAGAVKVARLVKTSQTVGKLATRAAPKIERAVGQLKRSKCSFVAGTLVRMADGSLKPIESLKLGDAILGADPASGETFAEVVIEPLSSIGDKRLVALTFDGSDSAVVATDNHPYWIESKGWVAAGNLEVGDVTLGSDGERHELESAVDLGWFARQDVYNLHASGDHTYFVTASPDDADQLVHNAGDACEIAQGALNKHIRGTNEHSVASKADTLGKSLFVGPQSARRAVELAVRRGTSVGRGGRKIWDAGVTVGTSPQGERLTRVMVQESKKGWHGWPVK